MNHPFINFLMIQQINDSGGCCTGGVRLRGKVGFLNIGKSMLWFNSSSTSVGHIAGVIYIPIDQPNEFVKSPKKHCIQKQTTATVLHMPDWTVSDLTPQAWTSGASERSLRNPCHWSRRGCWERPGLVGSGPLPWKKPEHSYLYLGKN